MDDLFSPAEAAFAADIEARLLAAMPADLREKTRLDHELDRADFVRAQQALHAAGLAVPHWPAEWGGAGFTPLQRAIYLDRMHRLAIPAPLAFNTDMIGPVLLHFGTEAQKARWLPATANLDLWWCQGFSEPDAGSDLASLRTKATRIDGGWRVEGQKTWTSYAQHADMMFALVRTDPAAPKKQLGISMLAIDMRAKGVSLRPIATMDGRHEVNEVFLDGVEVPEENLIGPEGKGWDVAKYLLVNERHNIAGLGWVKMRLARIRPLAAGRGPAIAARIAALEADLHAVEMLQWLALSGESLGAYGSPDLAANLLKIRGSQLQQATTELLFDLCEGDAGAEEAYFSYRKLSIYGGSNEIQRDILARAVLGA